MTSNKKPSKPTGGVHTGGGDFVAGDQNKVTIGNVSSGSVVTVGKDNVVNAGTQAGATLQELAALVAEIRAQMPQARLDSDIQEVIEGDFKVIEDQLKKPEPKKALVLPKLEDVAKTLTMAAGAGEAITRLAPMVEKAISWAQMLLK